MKIVKVAGAMLIAFGAGIPAMAQTVDGAKLFNSRCAVCHWDPSKLGEQVRMGPGLSGVVGRKAGTNPKYTRYSAGMKAYGKPWTEANLSAFLENPRGEVRGTHMAFMGLKKPEERAAIIAYLKKPH